MLILPLSLGVTGVETLMDLLNPCAKGVKKRNKSVYGRGDLTRET